MSEQKIIKVRITEDKLHGVCIETGTEYLIHHESKDGKDLTSLAEIASKSFWWDKDRPQFKPNTIQNAEILSNDRIRILTNK